PQTTIETRHTRRKSQANWDALERMISADQEIVSLQHGTARNHISIQFILNPNIIEV
ncbi:MAG: hypothetical protein IPK88_20200, partial [Saprospiraceae bacterium]|nr:hypothetical protein [Candidatus Defluviibacterium haderslevense]